jgi:hypothetical protein
LERSPGWLLQGEDCHERIGAIQVGRFSSVELKPNQRESALQEETGMIARIAGTVILSAIVFVVVSLLVSLGVYWSLSKV